MRIAVFHNLPPGGALRALYSKITALEKRRHQVSVYEFDSAGSDFFRFPKISGKRVVEPIGFSGELDFKKYANATRFLAHKIENSDVDFVIVEKCRYLGSPLILRFLTKPHLFYTQEPLRIFEYERLGGLSALGQPAKRSLKKIIKKVTRPGNILRHFLIKSQDKKNIQAAGMVMTNSLFTRRWLKVVYDVDAVVNYQGVDTEFFSPDLSLKRKKQVLSVGRMNPTKGHDFLLDVLARTEKQSRPEWIIVSDAVDEEYFKSFDAKARRLNVSYQFHCGINDASLRHFYQTSALVLCASHQEPFGLVPLEAMACGTPVMAVNEGGYKETIPHGWAGYLLERNEKIWADKLQECLARPEIAKQMGRAGRDHVLSQWTWDLFIDRLLETIVRIRVN